MRDTDRDWEKWGRDDPYFGVISDPKFRKNQLDVNLSEFWKTGEESVDHALRSYELAFGPLPRGQALDFGCGVGRLTLALSGRFDRVVGVDVSPSMLIESRQNAEARNRTNVDFLSSGDELTNNDRKYDFVISIFVLQHIPVSRGLSIFTQLLGKIRPGGGCYIQLSVRRNISAIKRVGYWVRDNIPGANPLMNLMVGLPASQPGMQMNAYPVDEILMILQQAGMENVFVSLGNLGHVFSATFTATKRLSAHS